MDPFVIFLVGRFEKSLMDAGVRRVRGDMPVRGVPGLGLRLIGDGLGERRWWSEEEVFEVMDLRRYLDDDDELSQ
jgi:hypothetical protein